MDTSELKLRLGRILAEEEGDGPVDWLHVEHLSDQLRGELHMPIPSLWTSICEASTGGGTT